MVISASSIRNKVAPRADAYINQLIAVIDAHIETATDVATYMPGEAIEIDDVALLQQITVTERVQACVEEQYTDAGWDVDISDKIYLTPNDE